MGGTPCDDLSVDSGARANRLIGLRVEVQIGAVRPCLFRQPGTHAASEPRVQVETALGSKKCGTLKLLVPLQEGTHPIIWSNTQFSWYFEGPGV